MGIEIREEPIAALAEQALISIAFEVTSVLGVTAPAGGLGGLTLNERYLASTYVKDYDAAGGNDPSGWAQRFDVSNWGLLGAYADEMRIAGAVVAFDTDGVDMLEGRSDLAVVWDIRVAPAWRRQGVGGLVLRAAESWSRQRGCRVLKVETQNINVAACRLYAGRGFVLGAIDRFAYPQLPHEVQLLWYKDLIGNE